MSDLLWLAEWTAIVLLAWTALSFTVIGLLFLLALAHERVNRGRPVRMYGRDWTEL